MIAAAWPPVFLAVIVIGVLFAEKNKHLHKLFTYLPVPLWCYALPMFAVLFNWLPENHASFAQTSSLLMPVALVCLLLGANVPAITRLGNQALLAGAAGALGILLGSTLGVWLLQHALPAQSWKGSAALCATWTGGTMNLMAMQLILDIPASVFAPLIIVDALIAYSWMALLVSLSGWKDKINWWLCTSESGASTSLAAGKKASKFEVLACLGLALIIVSFGRLIAALLPKTPTISSLSGWTIMLVTTLSLLASLFPAMRRIGAAGTQPGTFCLYMVLAATGAQASLQSLGSAPGWIILGLFVAVVHGALMLGAGKLFHIPLGVLATASQANIGGVVSAPLVGAVYHPSLVAVGLLLAVAGNSLGTYFGLLAGSLSQFLQNL